MSLLMGADKSAVLSAVGAGALIAGALVNCLRHRQPQLAKDHWLQGEGQIVGHRGCRIPEVGCSTGNTMSAFRRASANSKALELDVQMTTCGEVVVFHDLRTGKILEGERKRITQCTYNELLRRNFVHENDKGERVPTLTDVIRLAREEQLKLVVELKGWVNTHEQTRKVVGILEAEGYLEESMIISFNPAHIYWVRALSASLPTAFIASDGAFEHHARKYGLVPLVPLAMVVDYLYRELALRPYCLPAFLGSTTISGWHPNMTAEVVERAQQAGYTTNAWTVNSQDEAWRLHGLGVNLITTDKPYINFEAAEAAVH